MTVRPLPLRFPAVALVGALVVLGCAPRTTPAPRATPLTPLAFRANAHQIDTLAVGVVHHAFVVDSAPWRIHVLDVDRSACWSLEAVKAAGEAVGRALPSALLRGLAPVMVGAVNADFFLYVPPGVPTGAAIHRGRVTAGPGPRPLFAVMHDGQPWIGVLNSSGTVTAGNDRFSIASWNRKSDSALAWFDASWGAVTDTVSGALRVVLGGGDARAILAVDSSGGAVAIPSAGGVLVLGASAPTALRQALLRATTGTMQVRVTVSPFTPREAVGGFPVLVRDSTELAGLESAGGSNFGPVRHPRTIVGLAHGGRRVLLVTVDGRQPGYSAGMTLRESAALMLALGAVEALNLDGGGSTTMVVQDRFGRVTVANRPSDAEGERQVANILGVVRGCSAPRKH